MTRINTIDPVDLLDQHLMAEYRELPRAVNKANPDHKKIPPSYRMGSGHVLFFYDKTTWLVERHRAIVAELLDRGYNLSHTGSLVAVRSRAWVPRSVDHEANLGRLQERLSDKPGYYRLRGEPVCPDYYDSIRARYQKPEPTPQQSRRGFRTPRLL